jgi:hypothetical protein
LQTAIESMHKDVITSFSNFVMGMEILRNALTQLLLYYTRLLDCCKVSRAGPKTRRTIPPSKHEQLQLEMRWDVGGHGRLGQRVGPE